MLRSLAPRLAGLAGAAVLTLVLAPAVLAKEGIEVTLAAPIPADALPGDTVTVFFTLSSFDEHGTRPLRGSPAFIRLYGRDGAMTQADGVEERTPGTYRASIVIPPGGADRATFGIHGARTLPDGQTSASDVEWAYDGVLVAAQPPAAVDPGSFGGPAVTRPEVVLPKDATEPVPLPAGSTPTPGPSTGPWIDPRLIGGTALAVLAGIAWTIAALRRRHPRPTTA